MKKRIFSPILFLVIGITAVSSSAQWKLIGSFSTTVSVVKLYPNNVIFVGLGRSPGSVASDVGISKSTDAGQTWVTASTPTGDVGEVSDILMTDDMNGFASVGTSDDYNPGLWVTADGGLSWTRTNQTGSFACLHKTPAALIVSDLFGSGWMSQDDGQTFTQLPFSGCNGIDFVDDLHGVVSLYRGPTWETTSDGGLTWTPCPSNTIESWSVYGVPGTSTFFAAPEGPTNYTPYTPEILRSTDFGQNWKSIANFTIRGTGHMTGSSAGRLYWQGCYNGDNDLDTGLFVSTDQGITWKNIGGPSGWNDSRFAILDGGCNGDVIYAPDWKGGLYSYGEGAVQSGYEEPIIVGTKTVPPLSTVDIPIGTVLSKFVLLDTLQVTEVYFTVNFDGDLLDMDPNRFSNEIIPHSGLTLESATAQTGQITVRLKNPNNATLTNTLKLADMIFNTYQGAASSTLMDLSGVTVVTPAETYSFCVTTEGTAIAEIIISSSDVHPAHDGSVIALSPNPAQNGATLSITSPHSGTLNLQMFDVLGRAVPTGVQPDFKLHEGVNSLPIDCSALAKGSYYLRATIDGVPHSLKLAIVR